MRKEQIFKKNDLAELFIEDMTKDGEGIGHADGYTLFVKDAVIGDRILAQVTKTGKSYGYARVREILEPSPERVKAPCPLARRCGGCTLQAMSCKAQLSFKENLVRRNLERIGGFSDVPMEPILGMENPWRYRNKAQYPVGAAKPCASAASANTPAAECPQPVRPSEHPQPARPSEHPRPVPAGTASTRCLSAGYYAARSHELLDLSDCLLSPAHNAAILDGILAFAEEFGITAYDETTGKGLLRHILIREGFATGEILICLVINGRNLPRAEELVRRLRDLPLEQKLPVPEIRSICLNVNTKKTNVILGGEVLPLFGDPWITDRLGGFEFRISPLSFYQVNPVQTLRLYETAVEFAGLTGTETVFDLFCGIGTISHFLAKKAREVYGVEIVPQAIRDAAANAARNHLTNAHFFAAAAEDVAARGYFDEHTPLVHPDVVVLDPPRKGCEESLLRTIRALAPDRIVYVSCDSATLARDCKILAEPSEHGEASYHLTRVRPCDMFPATAHVETVCLLSKLSEVKNHISVKVDMNEMDLTAAESKATYQEIKEWVKEKYGFHVSHLNIAKTKRKCGIIERQNYNLPKSEDSRSPETPKEKEEAIIAAFKAFRMI